MPRFHYKTLYYAYGATQGQYGVWTDAYGKEYGLREARQTSSEEALAQQLRQLEEALRILDEEGWELVSANTGLDAAALHGSVVLRRALAAN